MTPDSFSPTVNEHNPIGFATHGLGGKLLFDENELSPYWGLVSCYEPDHDEILECFDALGETWEVAKTNHWEGQLAPPADAQGVDGGMNEYQYSLEVADDWGDKDATLQFRPGYPDAENVHSGNPIQGMPDDCPESIRVQAITTNLEPDEIRELLRALADHIGLNPDYFASEPHEYSRAYQIERYARLYRAIAEDHLSGAGGVIDQLADFASNQSGRGKYRWDHEDIQGHYQAVAFDPETWELLIPSQEFGKQFKCYHPNHVRDPDTDDPLAHPKVETSYSNEYDPDDTIPWSGLDRLIRDLDEAAYNVLHWGGVPVQADPDVWNTEDPYFDVEPADEPITLHSNPLPDLREATENHVESELLRSELTGTDRQLVEALTDGGSQHYETLSDSADVSTSAVYRLLDRLSSLVDSDNGVVDFADDVTRNHVGEIVDQVRETADWAKDSIRDIAEHVSPLHRLDDRDEPSALEKWMNRHGIELVERSRELHFRLQRRVGRHELREILRAGLEAAEADPLLTSEFEDSRLTWTTPGGDTRKGWQIIVDGEILFAGG